MRFSFHLLSQQKIHFTCQGSLRNFESFKDRESAWVKGCDIFNQLHAQLDSCAVLHKFFRVCPPFTVCEGWKWKAMLQSSLSIHLTHSFILCSGVCVCRELYNTWRKLSVNIRIHLNGTTELPQDSPIFAHRRAMIINLSINFEKLNHFIIMKYFPISYNNNNMKLLWLLYVCPIHTVCAVI